MTTTAKKTKAPASGLPEQPVAQFDQTPAKAARRPLTPDLIGEVAGCVWRCLNEGGPQTLARLKKDAQAPADIVMAAVGWLAREGKLNIETNGKAVTVALS